MPTTSPSPHTDLFTKLFTESRQALHRYILRFVGSSETAKEIVQEAFLRTYRERDSVTTLRAFLFSTARNLAANEYRHRRTVERGTEGDLGDPEVKLECESLEAGLIRDERESADPAGDQPAAAAMPGGLYAADVLWVLL